MLIYGYFCYNSVYWDNEDVEDKLRQRLYGQTDRGDVLLYNVDKDGVTVPFKVPASKISSLIKNISLGKGFIFLIQFFHL